jgi:hypothetical protein
MEIVLLNIGNAMPNFSARDLKAIRVSAERMVRVANDSLAIANTSRNLATRASRTNVVRVNIQRLKELSVEYPFLHLTSLTDFEASVRKVEQDTAAMAASGKSEMQPRKSKPKRRADPFLDLSLSEQCALLEIPLDVIRFQRCNREWMFKASTFNKPEPAAFAYFKDQGFTGTYCEGAAPLMIMKCACLDYLEEINTLSGRSDACTRYFEAQCAIHSHLAHRIVAKIETSTEAMVRVNFREVASQPHYDVLYPTMEENALAAIWRAMSPLRLAQLARFILQEPGFRAGWPDLTLARGDELRFVEVKTTDRLHSSQKSVISEVLKPWGASVSVLQMKASG